METKQLAYFVLACHVIDHTRAASIAGITPSTLSESLAALEAETGLDLFRRGPRGRYPTEAARWLCQIGEQMLMLTEAAAGWPTDTVPVRIDVVSPLHLMLGRLYRAASLAARRVRTENPAILARIRFNSPLDPAPLSAGSGRDQPHGKQVKLSYDTSGDAAPEMVLFNDEWVAVTNIAGGADAARPMDLRTLRTLPVEIPPMLDRLSEQARNYCKRHRLSDPALIEEDVGIFSRLSRRTREFVLLAPRSLVAGGLQRSVLSGLPLAEPMVSPIIADASAAGTAGAAYVRTLQRVLAEQPGAPRYDPELSMRQLRYFVATADEGAVSAAARKLNVVQPALSAQLRKLEERLGNAVFERGARGMAPTAFGIHLLDVTREIVGCHERVTREGRIIAAAERHQIVIGLDPLAGNAKAIADAIGQWLEIYPGARVSFVERPLTELSPMVQNGEASFIIASTVGKPTPRIDLAQPRELGLLFAKAHAPGVPADGIPVTALAGMRLVVPPEGHDWRRAVEHVARAASTSLTILAETASAAMTAALLSRTGTAAIASRDLMEVFPGADELVFAPFADPGLRTNFSVLFSTERGLRDSERMLVRLLQKRLQRPGDAGRDDDSPSYAPPPNPEAVR